MSSQINVRKDRLTARNLEPGPWLSKLKQHLLLGNETARIRLPDGSDATAMELAAKFVLIRPGKKLVYATDLADTMENRQRLVRLAQHAQTFFVKRNLSRQRPITPYATVILPLALVVILQRVRKGSDWSRFTFLAAILPSYNKFVMRVKAFAHACRAASLSDCKLLSACYGYPVNALITSLGYSYSDTLKLCF